MQRIFFCFLCTLILAPFCLATPPVPEKAEKDEQITFSDVGRIRRSIANSNAKLDASYEQEHSLLVELDKLDQQASKQQALIDKLQTQVREQEKVIAVKAREERVMLRKNEALKVELIPRLRAFYFRGETGLLDVLFTSRSLPDLILMRDSFRFLVEHDRVVFLSYRANLEEIKQVKLASNLEKAVHEGQLAGIDRERQKLHSIAEEKNQLLKKVQTQKTLYLIALEEMKQVEQDLTTALSQHNSSTSLKEDDFVLRKGSLPPPVWGNVIRRFGTILPDEEGIEEAIFTHGIVIATPNPVDVIAVYDGEVVFADFMPGYGKVVIIHHDLDYYTVTARFDEINAQEGDWVEQGQTIGTTGEIATLFGSGLYFEIRREAVPENPLDWLQPGLPVQK